MAQSGERNWDSDHRTWGQRGGYGGYYIPQASFSLSFRESPLVPDAQPSRDVHGVSALLLRRLSFMLVDPWPGYWAANWYDTDDLYIDL